MPDTSTPAPFRFAVALLSLLLLSWLSPVAPSAHAQGVPPGEGLVADSTELRVLRQLYQATDGPHWANHADWPATPAGWARATLDSAATWPGVGVGGGDVVRLTLSANGLAGPLPAAVGRLVGLENVQLWQNQLTGPLPAAWGGLARLQVLGLGGNRLSGAVPPELGALAALQELDLSGNGFTGPLPAAWGQLGQLQTLRLDDNGFDGPLPAAWAQLAQLRTCSAHANALTGPLPAAWGQLAHLQRLYLWQNPLNDSIPAAWGDLRALQVLALAGCGLVGPLPARFGRLAQLQVLDASYNRLSGPLPDSLGRCATLQTIALQNNRFAGPIPRTWGRLATLYHLDLGYNALTGDLPDSLAQLTNLYGLGLTNNRLTGSLAPLMGMTHLQSVSANQNRFSGPLPAGLGRLTGLNALYFDDNALSGPLPAELGQLPALYQLTLNGNHLSGTVPAAVLASPSLYELRLHGNDLTGVEALGGATGLRAAADLAGNRLDFAALEALYQAPGQPRLSAVDLRGQRAPERVDTVRYEADGPLALPDTAAAGQYVHRYQWQRLVGGQWVEMPGDTLPGKRWARATAAEQGTYRRAVHDRWFTNPGVASTELYSKQVYADLLPYQPLARNRPNDATRRDTIANALPTPDATAARTGDLNYVRTWSPRVAVTDAGRVPQAGVDSIATSTTYLDGLGRPVQTVQHRASPLGWDLVQPVAYDALGRSPKQYLPYPANPADTASATAQGYHHRALTEQQAYYSRTGPLGGGPGPLAETDPIRGVARTGRAFAETVFEPSPLNRVVAQGAAGEAWQVSGGHVVERAERPSTAADSVLRFVPGYDPTDPDPGYQGFYAPGELWGTDVADAHGPNEPGARGYRTIEWKDQEGQVVLRQVEASRSGRGATLRSRWLRTAYAYDAFGRLRAVLPPEATKRVLALGNAPAALPTGAVPFLFHYRYDGRGRQIAKQVPGTDGETVVVFDQLDRPVLSQDAAQRARREWSVTKYDALGRVVLTGLLPRADTAGQATLQRLADADPATASQYEVRTDNGGYPEHYTYERSFPRPGQDGFLSGQVLSAMYYDDYNFDNDAAGTADATYNTSTDGQFPSGAAPVADVLRTTGLTTRTVTRVLGGTDDPKQAAWLTTTTFYDERARPVQVQTTNARKGLDLLTTQLDFTGKVVQSVAVHEGPSHAPLTVAEFFTYDPTGRLLTTRQQLPGETQPTQIASVAYNEIGQATQKTMGTGRLAQEVKFAYNIRGWLTQLNDPYSPKPADLFNLSLHYEQGFTKGYEQYNGNLTGQTWRSARDGVQRAYGYVYDPLNRLLQGDFVARNASAAATPNTAGLWKSEEDNYRLSFASYDDNGNLLTLRRRGLLRNATHSGPKQYGPVDALSYVYAGNRLQAVDDQVNTNQLPRPLTYNGAPTSLAGDFQEGGTHLGQEYGYDANGNLTQDRNKGITGIAYNHLNLPKQIHFGIGADSIVFRYTAAGQKVAKLVYQTGQPVQRTDYLGPYQYEQDSLRFFPHAEGRVLRTANSIGVVRYQREFSFKDHLGNLRLAYRAGQRKVYFAGLEPGDAGRETQQFDSLSVSPSIVVATGLARTGAYAARLHAGGRAPRPLGPLTQFAVQQGDTVHATAFGLYPQATSNNSFSLLAFIAGLLQPAPTGTPPSRDGTRRGGLPLLQVGLSSAALLPLLQTPGGVPTGYLRVLSFTEDSVLVDQRTVQLTDSALNNYQALRSGQLIVQHNGYVSVYVGNESAADVYFDDVTVEHRPGLQVQENQYDPFGLDLAGLTRNTPGLKPLNQYKFNGKEFQSDLGLNWNHQDWRFFDTQIGRWHVVDPEIENGQESWGPYDFGFDNAIRFSDPDGRCPGGICPPVPEPSASAAVLQWGVNMWENGVANPEFIEVGLVAVGVASVTYLGLKVIEAGGGGGRPAYMTGMPGGPGPGYNTPTNSAKDASGQVEASSGKRPANRTADRENGGSLGKPQTKAQIKDIAKEMKDRGYKITGGGGERKEEYIPGPDGGRKGSARSDITGKKDGRTVRVNTVDTNAKGEPDTRESNSAARIREAFPKDHLLLIPKTR